MQKNIKTVRNHWLFALLSAVVVAIVFLKMSEFSGRLSGDLTYDDVAYANDAASRLSIAANHGFFAFFHSFVENPPRSPFSTLLATIAFSLGGLNDFALYASNTLVLMLVALFISHELRYARTIVLLVSLGMVLLSPLSYRAIHDFRPDIALGFATAVMTWWLISGAVENDSRLFRRAGYALGACLLIKSTFFAHTLTIAFFLIGSTLIVHFLIHHYSNFTFNLKKSELVRFFGIGALISFPYFVVNWSPIVQHFWKNTRGEYSYIWSFPKDTPIRALLGGIYQLSFPFLGYHLVYTIVTLVICCILLYRYKAKIEITRIFALCATALVSLCIIVIGRHKNEFFLASFQWLLLLSTVYAISACDQRLHKRARLLFIGTNIIGIILVTWMNGGLQHWKSSPDSLHGSSWNHKIIDLIRHSESLSSDASTREEVPSVFVTFAGPVGASSLCWVGTKERFNINAFDRNRSSDLALFKSLAEHASYVVLPNEAKSDYYRWLPNASLQAKLLEWIQNDSRFKAINSFSTETRYFVFKNSVRSK